MLTIIQNILLPHDTDPSLIDFLKKVADNNRRYLIGIEILQNSIVHQEGYIHTDYCEVPVVNGRGDSRAYPLYLNAWNHVAYIVPSNKQEKDTWFRHDIRRLLEGDQIYPYYRKRIQAWHDNSQQI